MSSCEYRVLVHLVLSLTQENAVDLHSVGRVPLRSQRRQGENTQYLSKARVFITAWPSFHYSQFVGRFILQQAWSQNLCTVWTAQNTTDNNCIMSQSKAECTSAPPCICNGKHRLLVTNWGGLYLSSTKTSVAGHRLGRLVFIYHKNIGRWSQTGEACLYLAQKHRSLVTGWGGLSLSSTKTSVVGHRLGRLVFI